MLRVLIALLTLLPFTAWRADAQAMQRVRPPVKTPNCSVMPTAGRTVGELCTSAGDNTLRFWDGTEWVVIGMGSEGPPGEPGSAFDGCHWVNDNTTGGTGTKVDPWVGWASQIESGGSGNYCFWPGYYAQELVLWESSVDGVHIKCEEGATFLRQSASGGFFRSVDSQSPLDTPVSITNFSVEGCTFDYNDLYTGEVGGLINYDASIGLWRTTGMHSDIVIRNNKWINLGEVAYSYYSTAPDSALLAFYAGKRFLLEGNKVIKTNFDPDQHAASFVWFTAGEDIVITDNEFTNAGGLKLEAYNWQLWGNTQHHMQRVVISRNKFTNHAFTNIILRNTCIVFGADGPTSIHDILVSNNMSTVSEYTVAGKGLIGIAATWAPDAYCDDPDKPIFSENIVVANNQMRGMHGNFISVGGEGTVNHYGAVKNLTVIGNVADGAYPGEDTIDASCDYSNPNGLCTSFGFNSNAFESENITVVGNTFKNTYNSCIYVYGSNVTISGNTCENSVMHEDANVFYINAAIIADGDDINITGNTVRNPGDPDNSLDGTNPFQPYGIFIPAGAYTQNVKVTNNLLMDTRDYDIDGDSTIEDVNGDGTTAASDQRAMGYGIRIGTGGSYGEFIQLTGNTIMGAITKAWQMAAIPDTTVVYGNIVEQEHGVLALAPSVAEMTGSFDNTNQSCLSVTRTKKIFEDTDCDGIQDVTESGVSDPTPLSSNLYSVGDEADTQPSLDPYIMSGTVYPMNARQSYTDASSVATALQMYETSNGADMMVNITGQTDTSNIYAGLVPFYPFTSTFGASIRLTNHEYSAYLVGFIRTKSNKDIYDKTLGVFFWCDPAKDVDGDGTAGDEDTDGNCGEAGEDKDDCDWYAVSMGGDGTNDLSPDYSQDDSGGVLADATYTELTKTSVQCAIDPIAEEFHVLTIIFRVAGVETFADYYINGTLEASHDFSNNHLPGAWPTSFVGIWAQTNSASLTGFAWDYVGSAGYRRAP